MKSQKDKSQNGMVLQSAGNTERKYTTKAEEYILACEDEILDAPLREFLVKAEELGYTFFCKDIIEKVLISELDKKMKQTEKEMGLPSN